MEESHTHERIEVNFDLPLKFNEYEEKETTEEEMDSSPTMHWIRTY